MKQTNSAIKFLMAQYRAIFNNAYFKGLASAAIVTAAMAAGQAQADINTVLSGSTAQAPAADYAVSGAETASGGGFMGNLTIDGSGNSLTFSGSSLPHIKTSGVVSVTNSGSLTLNETGSGIIGSFDESFDDKPNSTLNVNKGTVTVTKAQIQINKVDLTDATVTVSKNIGDNKDSDWADNAQINAMLAADANGKLIEGTGVLTVAGKSTVNLQSGSLLTANVFNLDAGTIAMSGASGDGNSAVIRTYSNGNVNLNGADINVSDSGNYIAASNVNLKNAESVVTISGSGSLTVAGAVGNKVNIADAGAGNFNLDAGKIVVNSGGALVVAKDVVFNATKGAIENASGGAVTFNNTELNVNKDFLAGLLKSGTTTLAADATKINLSEDAVTLAETGLIKEDGSKSDALTISNGATVFGNTLTLGSAYKAEKLDVEAKSLVVGKDFTQNTQTLTAKNSLSGSGTYTLNASGSDAILNLDGSGAVSGITGFTIKGENKNGSLAVKNGAWDFGNATLTVSASGAATLTDAQVTKIGKIDINADGATLGLTNSSLAGTELAVASGASVTVAGKSSVTGTNLNIASGGSLSLENSNAAFTGKVTTSGATVALADNAKLQAKYAEATASGSAGEGLTDATLNIDGTSTLVLTDFGKTEIKLSELKTEKEKFFSGSGLFELAGVKVTDTGVSGGEVAYDTAKDGAGISGIYNDATVTGVSGNVANSHNWGAAELATGDSLTLDSGAALTLNGVDGKLVTNADGKDAGVTLASGAILSVQGNGGSLDNITTTKGNGEVLVGSKLVVANDIGANSAEIAELNVQKTGSASAKNVYANVLNVDGTLKVAENVSLASGNSTVNGSLTAKDITSASGDLAVNGSIDAANITLTSGSLAVQGSIDATSIKSSGDVVIGGSVVADKLELTAASKVTVGDADSSGFLELGSVNLSGGKLLIDPSFDLPASIVALKDVTDTTKDIINVNGDIGVGMNSVLAVGTDAATAKSITSRLGYLQGDKLQEKGVGAVLVVDNTLHIANGDIVIIDPTLDHDGLDKAISGTTANSGSFTLANNSALVITESMSQKALGGKVVIEFEKDSGSSFTLASGSKVSFDTAVTEKDTIDLTNAETVNTNGATIVAANGLLNGTADASGNLTFTLDTKAGEKLYNQSAPVKSLTLKALKGDFDKTATGVEYILLNAGTNGGKSIEGTANLAVYGGAVQGTSLAQQAANDAVVERMSRSNPNGSLVFANNAQGGGLWLSPVYKSHESDSFGADGVDYGVDGDLTGLVLGADSTSESGVRVGGYFNFGSADFDGQGVGDQVSSESDYFGFGLYAGMTSGQFSLLADAGFTQVSSDIEQNADHHKYSNIKADVDSTAVTLGLRGEYKLNVAAVDVTPHLGVRYTRLAIDSYDAKVNGKVLASTDFDTMQMFSIPFGVTVSKDIAAGAWTIKPVFDLTLTANAGDTDAKLNTTFIGANSLDLTSEAFDSFTYGATLGLDAKYGENFSIGLNTNYTGSSNTDEFGVMGNARYMF